MEQTVRVKLFRLGFTPSFEEAWNMLARDRLLICNWSEAPTVCLAIYSPEHIFPMFVLQKMYLIVFSVLKRELPAL